MVPWLSYTPKGLNALWYTFNTMSETGERITCFNGEECVYLKCPQFCKQLDTCNFIVIGLLKGTPRSGSPPEQTKKQSLLELEVGKLATVTGTLMDDPTIKSGTRNDGTDWTRNSFRIGLDGKPVRVTLWNPFSEEWRTLQKGDEVTLKDIAVKEYKGELQLSSIAKTDITLH